MKSVNQENHETKEKMTELVRFSVKFICMFYSTYVYLFGSPERFLAIRKLCPRNEYPLKPHFDIVKLGYAGAYLIFLFLIQKIDFRHGKIMSVVRILSYIFRYFASFETPFQRSGIVTDATILLTNENERQSSSR